MGFSIINKVIELVIGLSMITYGLFNAGGVVDDFASVNTTNFTTISFIFTTLGPLLIGFAVLLYLLMPFFHRK